MGGESIIIDPDAFITVMISMFGVLLGLLGTLAFWLGKLLFNKFNTRMDSIESNLFTCHKNLTEKITSLVKVNNENRKSSTDSHRRLSDHVEKYHTTR